MTLEATLTFITVGNGLIGARVLLTAALLLSGAAVPAALSWLGIAGGAGLAMTALAFPLLGREHPLVATAGLVAVIGLVGFYAWTGMLMLGSRLGDA